MVDKKEVFLNNIINRFKRLGKEFSLTRTSIKRHKEIIDVYIQKNTLFEFGLQLEIDCRENDIYIYIVRFKNGRIPNETNLYFYDDKTWCRKYLEEFVSIKNPIYMEKKEFRYKREFISFKFSFYEDLLSTNLMIKEFFKTVDGPLSSDNSNETNQETQGDG